MLQRAVRKCAPPFFRGDAGCRSQWQKKRDERGAAVKISSVRRKAARKFGAPQQGHRPLWGGVQEVWLDVAYRIHIHYAYTPTKSSQSLPPAGGKKFKSLFTAICVWGKNTSQTANMEFCRIRQNYACSRPQTPLAENFVGIFASKKRDARGRLFLL